MSHPPKLAPNEFDLSVLDFVRQRDKKGTQAGHLRFRFRVSKDAAEHCLAFLRRLELVSVANTHQLLKGRIAVYFISDTERDAWLKSSDFSDLFIPGKAIGDERDPTPTHDGWGMLNGVRFGSKFEAENGKK